MYVRNPMNIHQISRISLSPEVVDGIVFWTKNPLPMIERLDELSPYVYYFQFTVNSYGKDVEPNIPSKNDVIIPAFQKLSKKIGKEKVIWRYDPIFFNEKYTIDYHVKYFKMLSTKLAGYTEKCTISFVDLYKNTQRNISSLNIQVPNIEQIKMLVTQLNQIAAEYGIYIDTCAEKIDLEKFGIKHSHCIDKQRFELLGQYSLNVDKDKNQRPECGCFSSIDIGTYNTCKNGCLYCYANYSEKAVNSNSLLHDPTSPLLFGTICENDVVKEREVHSCRDCQMKLF